MASAIADPAAPVAAADSSSEATVIIAPSVRAAGMSTLAELEAVEANAESPEGLSPEGISTPGREGQYPPRRR